MSDGAPARLSLREAVALGLLQGPTELLPVSSSAHFALIPRLLRWPSANLDAEQRNTLEVALHLGTAGALLASHRELGRAAWALVVARKGRSLVALALALAPPAGLGYLFERRLARRPDSSRALAGGLIVGALAMAFADARPASRRLPAAGPCDGLALGVAQALALAPGVSRNGATLAAARLRGFDREAAQGLSWGVGLPLLLGAAALKAGRFASRRRPRRLAAAARVGGETEQTRADAGPALAVGAGAAFLSTLACSPLLHPARGGRALLPFSLYRCGLALLALRAARG